MSTTRLLTKEEVIHLEYDPFKLFGKKIRSKHNGCENKTATIVSYDIEMTEVLDSHAIVHILKPVGITAQCSCNNNGSSIYEHEDQV